MGRITSPKTLSEEYFSWLYKQVGNQRRTYVKLCKELYNKKFRWFVPNDDNRCEDGLNLRDQFIEENGIDTEHTEVRYFLKMPCTVLEVLVALAQRFDYQMFDLNNQQDQSSKWFLEMLENLRLSRFTDNWNNDDRFDPVSEAEINEILEILMDRTYGFDGRGGLFPLKKRHKEDQSRVEIWYQMMLYLDENYGS